MVNILGYDFPNPNGRRPQVACPLRGPGAGQNQQICYTSGASPLFGSIKKKDSATRSKNIVATPQKIEKYFPTQLQVILHFDLYVCIYIYYVFICWFMQKKYKTKLYFTSRFTRRNGSNSHSRDSASTRPLEPTTTILRFHINKSAVVRTICHRIYTVRI